MIIRIQSVHFDADSKLLEFIEKKVAKLENFYDRIVEANVTLRLEKNGQVQDKIAEIKLTIPKTTQVAKETSKTFEQSIDDCVASLKRMLIKYKDRQRAH